MNNPLCPTCEALSLPSAHYALSTTGFSHLTRTNLLASSSLGCPLCIFLVTHSDPSWLATDTLVLHYFRLPETATYGGGDERLFMHLEGTTSQSPTKPILRISLLNRDVSSPEILKASRGQIENCQKRHSACSSRLRSVLPKRVICVGNATNNFNSTDTNELEDGLDESTVKLVIPPPGTKAPFLALSYCWGDDQPVKLRKTNLVSMQSSIDISSLSPSIQDAIWVTRQLGHSYIWVDALCILQDDADDQLSEFRNMSNVYQGATATIAASMAMRAADGFLKPKELLGVALDGESQIAGRKGVLMPMPDFTEDGYIPDHPLDSRGWTLQEFLLSERLLIFSDFEVLWQCQQRDLESVMHDPNPPPPHQTRPHPPASTHATHRVETGGLLYIQPLEGLPFGIFSHNTDVSTTVFGSTLPEAQYQWKTIVQQFTDRSIMNPEDRGHAIAGVAAALSDLWGDRYRYGLWNRWMVQLLGWYQPLSHKERAGGRSRRAPSWSWISLNGPVCFQQSLEEEDARLVEKAVYNGSLAREVDVLSLECKLAGATTGGESVRKAKGEGMLNLHWDLAGRKKEALEKDVSYLFLGMSGRSSGVGVGLMVARVSEGVFRRVGYMESEDPAIWSSCQRTLISVI